jgi:hypothetical protein
MPLVDMQHHMMYMIVQVFAFPTFAGIKSPVIHPSSFLTCITYHPSPYVLLHLLGAHASKRREQAYPALDFTTFSSTSYYSTLHSGNFLLLCADFDVSQPFVSTRHIRFSSDLCGALERYHIRVCFFSLPLLVSYFGCLMQALHLTLILSLSDLRQVRSVSGETVLDEIGLARVATRELFDIGNLLFLCY